MKISCCLLLVFFFCVGFILFFFYTSSTIFIINIYYYGSVRRPKYDVAYSKLKMILKYVCPLMVEAISK